MHKAFGIFPKIKLLRAITANKVWKLKGMLPRVQCSSQSTVIKLPNLNQVVDIVQEKHEMIA